MDTPSTPEQWQISMHSYLSTETYRNPLSWTDVGHAFVSISKDGKIMGSAGLWPMSGTESERDVGITFSGLFRSDQDGQIRPEFDTITDHDKDLRTTTWSITPEQAKKAFTHISMETDQHSKYNLYSNNCATWAKGVLDHVGVDTSDIHTRDCYVKTMRPVGIWGKLKDKGLGGLTMPSQEELEKSHGWVTPEGEVARQPLFFDPEKERRLQEHRLKLAEMLKKAELEKEKSAPSEPVPKKDEVTLSEPEVDKTPKKKKDLDDHSSIDF